LTIHATEGSYASWYITACKASFDNKCSFPKASKNCYTYTSLANYCRTLLIILDLAGGNTNTPFANGQYLADNEDIIFVSVCQ
jgi:hypothetical protein